MKVVVIGAGAAGLMAANAAMLGGNDVTVIEKNHRPARKVMITGKGRCNVTNNCDVKDFIANIPKNPRFLYSCVSRFSSDDTMAFFEAMGVPLKTERGNRVFPESDKAVDIVDALYKSCNGCKFMFDTVVTGINTVNGTVCSVTLDNKKVIDADSVIVATGGASYSLTGSTGDGYRFAQSTGHTVTDIRPSLVPIESADSFCSELSGLTLKNVGISVVKNGKTIYTDFGEMLFTHFGVSGPLILRASANIDSPKDCILSIDLKPALDNDKLNDRLMRDISQNINKNIINIMPGLVPSSMSKIVLEKAKVNGDTKCNQLTAQMRNSICNVLKSFQVRLSSFRPIEEAIITRGGVDVSQIDPKTMESKLCSGLYFVGEVLDVDGYTGGFNLQIAFSTGYAAGNSI